MILAKQFVFKSTIQEGMQFTSSKKYKNNIFSFDMLGEGARTLEDAEKYFEDYKNSIHHVGNDLHNSSDIKYANGVSIKISALHPRYERNKIKDLEKELLPKLVDLCKLAKKYNLKNKEKRREYAKKYYLKNKEKTKERSKKYYLENGEKIQKYKKEQRIKKRQKVNQDMDLNSDLFT